MALIASTNSGGKAPTGLVNNTAKSGWSPTPAPAPTPTPSPAPSSGGGWWGSILHAAASGGNYIKDEALYGVEHPINTAKNAVSALGQTAFTALGGETANAPAHPLSPEEAAFQKQQNETANARANIAALQLAVPLEGGLLTRVGVGAASGIAGDIANQKIENPNAPINYPEALKSGAGNAVFAGVVPEVVGRVKGAIGDAVHGAPVAEPVPAEPIPPAAKAVSDVVGELPVHEVPASAYEKAPSTPVTTPEALASTFADMQKKGITPVAATPLPGNDLGVVLKDNATGDTALHKFSAPTEDVPTFYRKPENAPLQEAAIAHDVQVPTDASAQTGNTQITPETPVPESKTGIQAQPETMPREKEVVSPQGPSETQLGETSSLDGSVAKPRGFVNTLQNSSKVTPEMQAEVAKIDPQTYIPLSNEEGKAAAREAVANNMAEAHNFVTNENTPWSAAKGHIGGVLMDKYAAAGDSTRFTEIANSIDNQARQAGQGNQALAKYGEMSPPNILKIADATAERHGQTLPEEVRQNILKQSAELQKMEPGSPQRLEATQRLVQDIASNIKTTRAEWFSNYRYQNMLSAPTPLEKIGYSGAFNTFITHPTDLFGQAVTNAVKSGYMALSSTPYERAVYFSDLPAYYKNVTLGMGDAWRAAMDSFKSDSQATSFEEGQNVGNAIEQARRGNIPIAYRLFSASHGAAYSYFKALISGGESARLMSHGIDEAVANKAGEELANKLTLRSKPGMDTNSSPAVQAVEAIGSLVSNISSKNNPLGTLTRWIAPFMRVSTNLAARGVEYSPLNLLDAPSKLTTETVGKSFMGSVVMGAGFLAAANGQVNLAAPTDKKESDLFYAAGRKPYSLQVGNTSIPLEYFGPFALSFMIPQAVKEATTGVNANIDVPAKFERSVENVVQFIVSTTPLPSIAQFFSLLKGDTTINYGKIAAGVADQVIPIEGLLRYMADLVDPIYRKTSTQNTASFIQNIQSGIPGLTQSLPAYTKPDNTPETRNASNFVAPYAVGEDTGFGGQLQARQDQLTQNAQAKYNDTQIAAALARGDTKAAQDLINQNYAPKDQAAAYDTAAKAAASDPSHVSNSTNDFFNSYNTARTQHDTVASQASSLVKQGKLNQARSIINSYNATIPSQFQDYTKKYGYFTPDAQKLVHGLRIGPPSTVAKPIPSF